MPHNVCKVTVQFESRVQQKCRSPVAAFHKHALFLVHRLFYQGANILKSGYRLKTTGALFIGQTSK